MSQERWDSYGADQLARLRAEPQKYIIERCPSHPLAHELVEMLGNLRGKRILDLGCGRGEFSVWLAKQGAIVSAVDLGGSLLEAARELALINGVSCDFRRANITELPFPADSFDAVTGLAILHHLSQFDVLKAVRECRRVSREAYFFEPVENSRVFDFLQNLIPVGKRPSILQRRKWREWISQLDDRPMTDAELRYAGRCFASTELRHYGLTVRFARLIGRREKLAGLDSWLLRRLPFLKRYSQLVLVSYSKTTR